jgi:hypothetical protein
VSAKRRRAGRGAGNFNMDIILAPFRLLWDLLAGILNLTGRVVALILGLVLLIVGVLLSATGLLACLGVPLAIFGGLLIIRGLF